MSRFNINEVYKECFSEFDVEKLDWPALNLAPNFIGYLRDELENQLQFCALLANISAQPDL